MTKKRSWSGAAYVLSFLIPVLVMLGVYARLGMAPWGDRTVLVSDMSSQYVEFFCALKQGDVFFSWSKALGTSYIGVFSYYVSSPLSVLTLFVPNEAMPIGLMFLIVLKIGLAGLSFCLFARSRFPGHNFSAVFCAVCYALMSYNMIYSICVMWLDGVIWLPLVLLALERMLAGKGPGPFIAALTVCFVSTWYISYMVGGFCALYLCARLVLLRPAREELVRVLTRFFGGAACALGLTAWMWLPTLLAMFTGKFSGGNVDYDGLLACTPLTLLEQLRPGQYQSITYGAPPYIFCGTAVLALATAYFFLRNVSLLDKAVHGALLAAMGLSMLLSPLDKVWHLLQRPNWFPFRYSFLCSFVLVCLACQTLGALGDRWGRRWAGQAGALALAAVTVLELGFNAACILDGLENQFRSASYRTYQEYYAANAQLVETARADSGGSFCRVGATEDRGHNSPLSFGYPGITHYSSLYNDDVNGLTKKLGFAQTWMWCAYYGSTPVTDALLDVEYVISQGELPGYELLDQAGNLKLWKNPKALPLAFAEKGEVVGQGTVSPLEGRAAPFERQNRLISGLLGEERELFSPVLADVEAEAGETVYRLAGTGKPLYMDLSANGLREVLVNGEHLLFLGSSEAACVHYLGTPAPGEEWTVTVRHAGGWSGELWELDQEALEEALGEIAGAEDVSVWRSGQVRMPVRGDAPQRLVTTIPAEKGWTAYVDGRRVETETWLDCFLALEVPAGEHEVELRYTAPGLVPGAALGVLAAAALALSAWRRGRKRA